MKEKRKMGKECHVEERRWERKYPPSHQRIRQEKSRVETCRIVMEIEQKYFKMWRKGKRLKIVKVLRMRQKERKKEKTNKLKGEKR